MRGGKTNLLILGSGAREHALARACAKSPMVGNLLVAPGNPGCASRRADRAAAADRPREGDRLLPKRSHRSGCGWPRSAAGLGIGGRTRRRWHIVLRTDAKRGQARRLQGIRQGLLSRVRHTYRRLSAVSEIPMKPRRISAVVARRLSLKQTGWLPVKVWLSRRRSRRRRPRLTQCCPPFREPHRKSSSKTSSKERRFRSSLCATAQPRLPFASAQDHKRVGEGDTGPNTGGMGAYSPPSIMTPDLSKRIMREIVTPTLRGMDERGSPFRGVLFAGLIVDEHGPRVIEFNVRFGDPRRRLSYRALRDDLAPLLIACANGTLDADPPKFCSNAALAVVMAARGYPGEPLRGSRIRELKMMETAPGVVVLHGATREVDGAIFADGGRVLTIAAVGCDVADARERAYAAIDRIRWPEGFFRRDIGRRTIAADSKE